ncbi:MAG: hypothetical protein GWO44_24485 [Thermoplasmata archaeon]|nr:hypothetical protein [Thermoplasmata archaeon]NIY06341.1 hypothetical protein [Thermoplasmata archaeon]
MAALWGWDDDEYFMPNRASNPFRVVKKEEKKENEVLVLQDLLKEVREADGLSMRIQWNSHDKEYECWGCDETVDKNSGECDCWNKVCMDCQNIAGMCACPQGWSSNLKFWTDVDEEVQEGALKRL